MPRPSPSVREQLKGVPGLGREPQLSNVTMEDRNAQRASLAYFRKVLCNSQRRPAANGLEKSVDLKLKKTSKITR